MMLELVENRQANGAALPVFSRSAESDRAADKGRWTPANLNSLPEGPSRQRTSESRWPVSHDERDRGLWRSVQRKEIQVCQERNVQGQAGKRSFPVEFAIDPNEPTYCLCNQVSYGEMIGCDNEQCPIEWFHSSCVSLTYKPKGKWYCPKCRR